MSQTKRLFLIFLIGIMITACKKEENIQRGKLIGFITLYDENGNLLQDKSGVNINAIGSSSYNTTSTNNGQFEIDNLPMGTYNVNFTKQGFAETKRLVSFTGGTTPTISTQSMSKPTTTSVNLLSLTPDTVNYVVKASYKLHSDAPKGSNEFVRFFYGTSDTVSYTNYDYSVGIGVYKLAVNDTMTHSVSIGGITLNNSYASGTKIYIVAYGEPITLGTTYTDINTGKTIYPGLNLNASQIKSIIIP